MACKTVQFKRGGRKTVKFCRAEATPAQRSAKARRARRILKDYACKAKGLTPALKKACKKLRA